MDRQSLQPDDSTTQKLPFVGVENIGSGTGILDFDTDSRIGSNKSTTFRFDERHVLYAKLRPYLNKVATPDFEGRCSTELVPLLPREGVDRDFLAHLLRREETVAFVMASVTGARMPRTDMKVLMSMQIPLPPIDEQWRIADILNRVTRIERLRARATDHFHTFTLALFVKMFGNLSGNDTSGSVPLDDLSVSLESGFACGKSNLVENGMLHLRPFNIGLNGELDLKNTYKIPYSFASKSKLFVHSGDILFNNTNSRDLVGKVALVHETLEAGFSNHITRIRLDQTRCEPTFLTGYLRYLWQHGFFRDRCTQWVSQAAYGPRLLARMPIPLPPLAVQRRFTDICKQAASTANNARSASKAASALTASLMDRLLDGSPAPDRPGAPGPA